MLKTKELLRMLKAEGWEEVRQTGSHRHFKHPVRKGIVTVAVHGDTDIPIKTLNSILKQAGLK
jgi:predicted RNA binding protein YcfA (HicA-like mRNA interferase family)